MIDQISSNSNGNGRAPYLLLQALIETSFESVKLLGLIDCGNQIAKQLGSPSDPLEALAKLELGMANITVSDGPKGGRLVCLKGCPFGSALSKLDPWSDHALKMVERFNASPRGGAAVHPICIGHLSVREAYGGINLGCRSTLSGKMAISVPALLEEAGMTETQVRERLDGNACLYLLRA
ncbi:MAG: hypothetical protein HZB51_30630 [Chloroflexi bacterium]|nr:hypothetical protein [Chloroflexota bacterium]